MTIVKIDALGISDWETFHDVFSAAFGFPEFYGRNMDAWIDCMTNLDDPTDGMTKVHCEPGSVLVLQLEHAKEFAQRCPEQYAAVVECTASVNWRRIETGEAPVLVLAFHM